MPVNYVEKVRRKYQAVGAYDHTGQSEYQWSTYDWAPWTPPSRPLSQCRVAILSPGGLSYRGQAPFEADGKNDLSFREIPRDARTEDVAINHNFYDTRDAKRDLNCVLPLERFREFEAEGIIGELAPVAYSCMGRIFSRTGLMGPMAADLIQRLRDRRVDVLFGVPT